MFESKKLLTGVVIPLRKTKRRNSRIGYYYFLGGLAFGLFFGVIIGVLSR